MSGPPLPFPNASAVPLVGQAVTVHGWFPTVMLTCNCQAANPPLMIVGLTAVAQCPNCSRGYVVARIEHDGQTGKGGVAIAPVVVPTREAPPT